MKRRTPVALGLAALVLTACSQGGNETTLEISGSSTPPAATATSSTPAAPTTSAPLPKPKPGPTKVLDTIATGLAVPWGIAFLPDGSAVVTERDTTRVVLIKGRKHKVIEVGTLDTAQPQGEAGLLGVVASPGFEQNRILYFYLSTATDNRVVAAKLSAANKLGEPEPIFTGIPNGFRHDGGRMIFGPDGNLFVSTGETGVGELAQDKESLGGKILRITPTGNAAPGNPFNSPVWSYGHRNVQGLAFIGNQLWASEFGDSTFDELNKIEKGGNYGWPEVEGRGGTDRDFIDPEQTWDTDDASPSGLAYVGDSLWMAALKGERLWEIPVAGTKTKKPIAHFVGDYGRMRTVAVAPDGNLWVTTSNRDGRAVPGPKDDQILLVKP